MSMKKIRKKHDANKLARARSRKRHRGCQECGLCDRDPACGWAQGFLLAEHRPDRLGCVLTGSQVPVAYGDEVGIHPLWALVEQEGHIGALASPPARKLIDSIAPHTPMILVGPDGADVVGPSEFLRDVELGLAMLEKTEDTGTLGKLRGVVATALGGPLWKGLTAWANKRKVRKALAEAPTLPDATP